MVAFGQRVQSSKRGFVDADDLSFSLPDLVTARSAALKVMDGTVAFHNPPRCEPGLLADDISKLMRLLPTFLCWLLLTFQAAAQADHASQIASLIDPAKLARLRERGANPRVQKAVYWLEMARKKGEKPP